MVQQRQRPRRVRRPDPPAHKPTSAARPMVGYARRPKVPWWVFALVALACGGLLYLVFSSGGGDEPGERAPGAVDDPTAIGSDPDRADADAPAPTIATRFAGPALGEDLELRVISLGDDPSRCTAASLRVDGEVKTAYHHRCEGREAELAFFLVRLTGAAKDPVTVRLDAFELVTEDGKTLEPVELSDVTKSFPSEIALGDGASRKGWVLFELGDAPASLRYVDGEQALVVRFSDTWL